YVMRQRYRLDRVCWKSISQTLGMCMNNTLRRIDLNLLVTLDALLSEQNVHPRGASAEPDPAHRQPAIGQAEAGAGGSLAVAGAAGR
ncbi:hypothetical protein PSYPI_35925, partial [Pseudomonas syringae pv. pisi str. 1704B]